MKRRRSAPARAAATAAVLLLAVACDRPAADGGAAADGDGTARAATSHAAVRKWDENTMADYRKPSDEELQKRLDPLAYDVTQHEGTEPPFRNRYWNNEKPGIYVDVVSGEPLFSSLEKFDSGTGWPSFWQPLEKANVETRVDRSFLGERVEVRSKHADSHLGHVFPDGPKPTGLRFCMNSASLRFVPVESLEEEGYGKYLPLFEKAGLVVHARQADEHAAAPARTETALFAGGCFWGVQEIVRHLPGVVRTEVGYTGGTLENPGYEDVHTGTTNHAEAVRVVFDPSKITYEELLGYFFRLHDPTTPNRQGNDVGTQYRSVIFVANDAQRKTAERVRQRVDQSGKWKKPVVTQIAAAGPFYRAEEEHQDYLQKHPHGYTCHFLRD